MAEVFAHKVFYRDRGDHTLTRLCEHEQSTNIKVRLLKECYWERVRAVERARKGEKENSFNFTCSVAAFLHFVSRFQLSVAKKIRVSRVKNHNEADFFFAFVRNP